MNGIFFVFHNRLVFHNEIFLEMDESRLNLVFTLKAKF